MSKKSFLDKRLVRLDTNRLGIKGLASPKTTIFANEGVLVEAAAVDELLQMLQLEQTIKQLKQWAHEQQVSYIEQDAELLKVVVTPDVHKGAGIPIGTVLQTKGFVVPAAIGADIGCGMRLHVTDWKTYEILPKLDAIESGFRHVFFEGGRNIPMTRKQRKALLLDGLKGLAEAVSPLQEEGLWGRFHQHRDEISTVMKHGSFGACDTLGLSDFMNEEGLTRDGQIGSIGGGNHFVELQQVVKVHDAVTAHTWGLKVGHVAVMVHSGSVAIGHLCAEQYLPFLKEEFPRGLKHPSNKLYVLTEYLSHAPTATDTFWSSMANALNFAFANRLFLALMALDVLHSVAGERSTRLVYDSPHNFVEENGSTRIHRKGACPARLNEPVIVPGSMGSSSFILKGLGSEEALCSASHGAGRRLSRGEALKSNDAEFEEFMRTFRIVTPVDFNRADIRQRQDIVRKKMENIKAEAPCAYKDIEPVVATLKDANIAVPVAELKPILTVKG
jgi:tRNA-splicing ligase RtcB